jgi:hypothetical protein
MTREAVLDRQGRGCSNFAERTTLWPKEIPIMPIHTPHTHSWRWHGVFHGI